MTEQELREAVLADAMDRMISERGEELLALDWGILNVLAEGADETIAHASKRRSTLKAILDGKLPIDSPETKSLVAGSIKRRMRGEERLIKRARRKRARDKKRGFEQVAKPEGLAKRLDGVSLGRDPKGYFAYTHRARCKSYPEPGKIPLKKIQFIRSTG